MVFVLKINKTKFVDILNADVESFERSQITYLWL